MSILVDGSIRVTSARPADAKSIWPSTGSLYLNSDCPTGIISSSWRYEGMTVYCLDDEGTYTLIDGITDEHWKRVLVNGSASYALNTLSASVSDTASLALSVAPNIELISGSWRNAVNTQRITLSDANGMQVEWSETGTFTPVLKVNTDAISIPAFAGNGNRGLYVDNAGAIRTDDITPLTTSLAIHALTASMLSDPIVFSHDADETYNVTTQNLNAGLDSKAVVLVQVPTVTGSIKAVVSLGADQSINSLVIDTTTKTLFSVNENGVAEINSTGIDPYTNGLNNLGTNTMRWGTVYANVFDGTASYANSSSWANTSVSASYALLAKSASYYPPQILQTTVASASWVSASVLITTARTASYVAGGNVKGAVASATSATTATTASYARTASWANNVKTASYSSTSSIINFAGTRSITRNGYSGIIAGGNDLKQFIDNFFFPFVSASVAIANGGTTYYEEGTTQSFAVTSTITANNETSFGSGSVKKNGTNWNNTTSPASSSFTYTDTGLSSSATYQTYVQAGTGVIASNTRTATFIYPYLYGMSATAGLTGTALYNAMTKSISIEEDKTVRCVGNVVYIYFCYPATYSPLTSILDPNTFEILTSFEQSSSVSVTSTGLTNNWTTPYRVYRTKLVSDPTGNHQFHVTD